MWPVIHLLHQGEPIAEDGVWVIPSGLETNLWVHQVSRSTDPIGEDRKDCFKRYIQPFELRSHIVRAA